jgi:tetratricopeptide (TPR) repeat protein
MAANDVIIWPQTRAEEAMVASESTGLHRFRRASDKQEEAELQLQAGRVLVSEGAHQEARRLFHAALEADPACLAANLELARLARSPAERHAYLRQVLALDPAHPEALAGLATADTARRENLPSRPESRPSRRQGDRPRSSSRVRALLALDVVAGLLLAALLLWGPVDAGLAWLFPSTVSISPPAATRTPAEIAARFVPQLEAALTEENWGRALEIVEIMQGVDPAGQGVQQWAPVAHLRFGQDLVQGSHFAEALAQFDQALAWSPDDAEARQWQQVTQAYLDGEFALSRGDWAAAIEAWLPVHEQLPEYGDLSEQLGVAYRQQGQAAIEEGSWDGAIAGLSEGHQRLPDDGELAQLLASAYRQRGIAWQEQGKLQKARADLEAALSLSPDDAEAQKHYDQVMYILLPPKRIEINISTQHLYAWKGDTLVYSWPVSTGLPGRDTATGHFEVLDKIPMAYSSIWRLKMPYWLGIYYVGNIENGIHALPIRPDGSVMWAGLLGQRASYGCVILSNEAAQLLYEWAEIGTKVDIHY